LRVLASLGIRYRVEGCPPARGLVVSNHLSYLDILIYGAVMPCFFVSKTEVEGWPFFGSAARAGGTLFLNRSSRASARAVAEQIAERLQLPVPVLLFPEGTSSDGSRVLHFHSRLFDPATTAGAPVTAAAVRYVIDGGAQERDLCWFGDAEFLPHLWKALVAPGFSAEVRFGASSVYPDRRVAAHATYTEITDLRNGRILTPQ
jgi:1-acyl-sn-glycerol-3-phosphate acyltransferase